jgi:hypothetical protein
VLKLTDFRTQLLEQHPPNRKNGLHIGSPDHHPTTNWVQKTVSFNTRSSAPDYGRKRPKNIELKNINKLNLLHHIGLTLFH